MNHCLFYVLLHLSVTLLIEVNKFAQSLFTVHPLISEFILQSNARLVLIEDLSFKFAFIKVFCFKIAKAVSTGASSWQYCGRKTHLSLLDYMYPKIMLVRWIDAFSKISQIPFGSKFSITFTSLINRSK